MKLIFLDIDGVLNSDLWYKNKPSLTSDLSLHLDPRCIALLNKISTKTKAKVVLSSTWRHHYSLQEIQAIFKTVGFEGEIIATTPDLVRLDDNFVRGNEILKWCKNNEQILGCRYQHYKDYVINTPLIF